MWWDFEHIKCSALKFSLHLNSKGRIRTFTTMATATCPRSVKAHIYCTGVSRRICFFNLQFSLFDKSVLENKLICGATVLSLIVKCGWILVSPQCLAALNFYHPPLSDIFANISCRKHSFHSAAAWRERVFICILRSQSGKRELQY